MKTFEERFERFCEHEENFLEGSCLRVGTKSLYRFMLYEKALSAKQAKKEMLEEVEEQFDNYFGHKLKIEISLDPNSLPPGLSIIAIDDIIKRLRDSLEKNSDAV